MQAFQSLFPAQPQISICTRTRRCCAADVASFLHVSWRFQEKIQAVGPCLLCCLRRTLHKFMPTRTLYQPPTLPPLSPSRSGCGQREGAERREHEMPEGHRKEVRRGFKGLKRHFFSGGPLSVPQPRHITSHSKMNVFCPGLRCDCASGAARGARVLRRDCHCFRSPATTFETASMLRGVSALFRGYSVLRATDTRKIRV